jgi:formate hydrogenlyase subunit 4
MIDEFKGLEYSGRGAALIKWGGYMKFFVLMCIFLNVLVTPWGLAGLANRKRVCISKLNI